MFAAELDDAVADDARHGDADRAGGVGELREQLDEHLGHRLGRRRLRGLDPLALGGEVAALEVDRRALDAGAAEVDAEGMLGHPTNLPHWSEPPQPNRPTPRHTRGLHRGVRRGRHHR